ncbi:MAG: patatin-like phospholipase family protein [Candidatus Baltobacteraceae bacterium]
MIPRALVLSGGGALGAYEAGIVEGLVAADGVRDGQPLRNYGLVAGTSIGAINGWFVATGQYHALRDVWEGIAGEDILQLKPRFAKLAQSSSGVGSRVAAAVRLALGLFKDERAVAETAPVLAWLRRRIDPRTPLLIPLVWAVTNLTTQRPEYFYRLPPQFDVAPTQEVLAALHVTLGPAAVLREATDDILHLALFASTSIPIVFDPISIPGSADAHALFSDGGVASNSPVAIAHTLAQAIDVVLLDPPLETPKYGNALEIALGAFQTMQRKIVEAEMRDVYFQGLAKRAFERAGTESVRTLAGGSQTLESFLRYIPASTLAYVRPEATLPVEVASFDDREGIAQTLAIGRADAARGFTPYSWDTFAF